MCGHDYGDPEYTQPWVEDNDAHDLNAVHDDYNIHLQETPMQSLLMTKSITDAAAGKKELRKKRLRKKSVRKNSLRKMDFYKSSSIQ
jgi:hypothetical protein